MIQKVSRLSLDKDAFRFLWEPQGIFRCWWQLTWHPWRCCQYRLIAAYKHHPTSRAKTCVGISIPRPCSLTDSTQNLLIYWLRLLRKWRIRYHNRSIRRCEVWKNAMFVRERFVSEDCRTRFGLQRYCQLKIHEYVSWRFVNETKQVWSLIFCHMKANRGESLRLRVRAHHSTVMYIS